VFVTNTDARRSALYGQALASALVVRGQVERPPPGTQVLTNTDVFADLRRPLKSGAGTIDMMRYLLWLVAAGIVGSILYLQAMERTRDFAVFKAIGITGRSLAFGLATQAVALALLATVVAIMLSIALAPLMPVRAEVPRSAYLLMPAVAMVISVLASLFGLRRAVSVDPALAFGGAG
jgi:putative ABC transport system permease protein